MWRVLDSVCCHHLFDNRQVIEGPPFKLVEAAAQAICDRVLAQEPRVSAVRVAVRKPHVALSGPLESVGASWVTAGGAGLMEAADSCAHGSEVVTKC